MIPYSHSSMGPCYKKMQVEESSKVSARNRDVITHAWLVLYLASFLKITTQSDPVNKYNSILKLSTLVMTSRTGLRALR